MSWRNETALVQAIRQHILSEWPSAWIFKVHGNPYQTVGVPDLLVCIQGRLVGLEVKHQKPGESRDHALGRASLEQLEQIRRIRMAGGVARVVLTPQEAVETVRETLASGGIM